MYVYEGTVVEDILKANAIDIINAADKYGVVRLKLEAEAAYVESTKITVDKPWTTYSMQMQRTVLYSKRR